MSIRLALLPLALVSLHPLHTTLTELVQRAGSPQVTLVVRAFSDDLRTAVHGTNPTPREPDDSLTAHYLRGHLTLRSATGVPAPLRWISRRETGDLTWITLEATLPGGLSGAQLRNTIHAELFHDQVNIVQVRYDGRSESLLFVGTDGEKTLR